jgi:predicted DNA binding CopG/RHH family protein
MSFEIREPRKNSIVVRLTDDEKEKIESEAEYRGLYMSEFIRLVVMNAIENEN